MRCLPVLCGLLVLVACGGSSETATPTPTSPTTPTTPTVPVAPVPDNNTPRTLFSAVSIGAAGGTLRYSKSGDALDGLTLVVPSTAYTTPSQWTIVADSTVVVPLPATFSQVGPALVITNTLGYAASPIALTTPMAVPTGYSVAPFYFDVISKKLEPIPLVDFTSTSATLAALHFSNDFTATRGPTHAAVRATLHAGAFASVVVVWVKVADNDLKGTFNSTFKSGRDDWEFVNNGDYVAPGGDCEGMSITAIYYQYFVHDPLQTSYGLYHQYDSSLPNTWDNVQGIRFAGSVQGDYSDRFAQGVTQLQALFNKSSSAGTRVDHLTASWLMLTFKLTGNPVLLAIQGPAGGHAVVAYAGTSSGSHVAISFADPNFPAVARTMNFEAGVLTPVSLQLNASSAATNFVTAYALGVTAEVPLTSIDARYEEFKLKKAGQDRYPSAYKFAYFNALSNTFDTLGTALTTANGTFQPVILCPTCPSKQPGITPDGRMRAAPYNDTGITPLDSDGLGAHLARGVNHLVVVGYARSPYSTTGDDGFLDSKEVTVNYVPPPTTITLSVGVGSANRPAAATETVQRGATLALVAVLKDSGSVVVNEPVLWSSSNVAFATVDAVGGIVTGVAAGTAIITAQSSSVSRVKATVTVRVTTPNTNAVASMVITPKTWSLKRGEIKQFAVTLLDAAGNETTLPAGIRVGFAEDDSNLGSISSTTGLFTADPTRTGSTFVRAFLLGTGAPNNIFDVATVTITP